MGCHSWRFRSTIDQIPHECALIHYGGMGLVKSFVIVGFLLPYLAIRLVLRKK